MSSASNRVLQPVTDGLSKRNFDRLAAFIYDYSGIKMPPTKLTMLEGRLRRRLRATAQPSLDAYCDFLFKQGGLEQETVYLIDAVTTNKTDFFREPEHFTLLAEKLVPELIALRRNERNPPLKVWSAASSTGAEPYTLAMVLSDLAANRRDFRFAILGTDISTAVLAQGRRAVYPAEMVAPVPPEKQARYVMHARKPGVRAEVRMAPEIRRSVRFAHLNLMQNSYPFDRDVDVIFLRNVLIYFDKRDQEAVISRLIEHLRPGGYLALGHSESMVGTTISMRQVAPAVFQKT